MSEKPRITRTDLPTCESCKYLHWPDHSVRDDGWDDPWCLCPDVQASTPDDTILIYWTGTQAFGCRWHSDFDEEVS